MKTCLIISGGEFSPIAEHIEYDYVIACDMGYEHSKRLGIKPDLLMGDFDSIRDASSPFPEDISLMSYPKEKDDTDTMLAVKCALDKGFRHLIIICGLGGRMDHSIANIQTMAYAAKKGALCELYSEKEYIRTFLKKEVNNIYNILINEARSIDTVGNKEITIKNNMFKWE